MRHFTKASAIIAVVAAGSASSAFAVDIASGEVREVRNTFSANADRTGTAICYSALDASGFGFTGSGGLTIYADDILMNKPGGTRIDGITFSVVSFNSDGSYPGGGTGGVVTADLVIALVNADPGTGLPDFGSIKATIPVTGIQIGSFSGGFVTIDVKDLNIVKKDELMWAAIAYTNVVGPANADGTPLIDNVGQLITNAATKGFSEDFFYNGATGGLSFFGGAPANPYANFGWEFTSVPTPGAMAIFGLAGVAATRRRR
jgi:MYXO-CTERM domain-containing protein